MNTEKQLSQSPSAIASREWRKANPEKARAAVRRWANAHPEKVKAIHRQRQINTLDKHVEAMRVYRAKKKVEKLKKQRDFYSPLSKLSASRKDEVRRHLSKGRDVGTIAVWMNQPVSVIQQIITSIS